jgi:hypothetical protein
LEHENRRVRLQKVVEAMQRTSAPWDPEVMAVSADSATTANRFLRALPIDCELPKVAPDGEGDILLVWEPPAGNCIVIVEGDNLHMVDQPGTRSATHVHNQKFLGDWIPVSILHAIPRR